MLKGLRDISFLLAVLVFCQAGQMSVEAEATSEPLKQIVVEYNQKEDEDLVNEEDYKSQEKEIEKLNKLNAIGTEREQEVWGYDVSRVLRVLYHECGANYCSDELVYAVTTCVYNSVNKYGWTPEQVINNNRYATPKPTYSERILNIFIDVFLNGNVSEQVGNAELFYNPDGLLYKYSSYHESQIYVCTIDNVRFFEMR